MSIDRGWAFISLRRHLKNNNGGTYYGSDGSSATFNSDGSGRYYGSDGSSATFNSDGSGSYFGADGSSGTLNSDGSGSYFGADGSSGTLNSDGSGSYFGADGSSGTLNSDGSGSYFGADGSSGTLNSDGSGSYFGADGSSETLNSDGSGSYFGADGSSGTLYSDGSSSYRYESFTTGSNVYSGESKSFVNKKTKVRLVIAYILVCIILCLLAYVFLQHVPGTSGAILLLFAILLSSFPIVLYITRLFFKSGAIILWGVYILIVGAVFLTSYKSKTGHYPYFNEMTERIFSYIDEVTEEKNVVVQPSVMDNIYANIKGNDVIKSDDIGSTYVYFYDGWNYYIATILSKNSIQIKNYYRFIKKEKEKFEYNYDVCIIKTDDSKNNFSWFNDSHDSFIVNMSDASNHWDDAVLTPFSRIDEKSKAWKKNYATEGTHYSYQYDKWNNYQAVLLSDDLVKIENWYRGVADEKTPFLHNNDVVVIKIGDTNNDFEWINDDKTAFTITLKDANKSDWEEDRLTCFTISEEEEDKGFFDFLGG